MLPVGVEIPDVDAVGARERNPSAAILAAFSATSLMIFGLSWSQEILLGSFGMMMARLYDGQSSSSLTLMGGVSCDAFSL
jgi:hypothetical protein